MMECARPAKIGKAPLKEIQNLETKLGVTLVAFVRDEQPFPVGPFPKHA